SPDFFHAEAVPPLRTHPQRPNSAVRRQQAMIVVGAYVLRTRRVERHARLPTHQRPFAHILEPRLRRLHTVQQPVAAVSILHRRALAPRDRERAVDDGGAVEGARDGGTVDGDGAEADCVRTICHTEETGRTRGRARLTDDAVQTSTSRAMDA